MSRTLRPWWTTLVSATGLFLFLLLLGLASVGAEVPPPAEPAQPHLADTDDAESSLSATVTPTPTPPLRLTVTDSPDPVAAGAGIDYSINVRVLDILAYDSVYVAATLPAGTLFLSASDGGVRNADGSVSWQLGTMAGGTSKTLGLTVRTSVTAAPGHVYEARFQLSYRCSPASYVGETIRMCMQEVTVRTTVQSPELLPRSPTPTVLLCRLDEAGWTFDTASPITLGVKKRAAICPAGDGDVFSFQANVGDSIDVLVNEMSADVSVTLYRPDYGQAASGRNGGDGRRAPGLHRALRQGRRLVCADRRRRLRARPRRLLGHRSCDRAHAHPYVHAYPHPHAHANQHAYGHTTAHPHRYPHQDADPHLDTGKFAHGFYLA